MAIRQLPSRIIENGVHAWVNFNGTGTVAIRDSGNVSSITDNATGVYTINFTSAMPDVNYSISAVCQRDRTTGSGSYVGILTTPFNSATYTDAFSTSSVKIQTQFQYGTLLNVDPLSVHIAILR